MAELRFHLILMLKLPSWDMSLSKKVSSFLLEKKIYLEQKRETGNQFIMTLEGGQSYHSPKLKRIKKCSNKLLLVKYIREIIRATSRWFCLNNMNVKHINVYHSPFFIRALHGWTFLNDYTHLLHICSLSTTLLLVATVKSHHLSPLLDQSERPPHWA